MTCAFGTFLGTEIRQKQHSDLVKTFNHTDHPILKYLIEPNCTDRATLVAEQVPVRFTSKMAKVDDDFQLYPCFNGLPSESLEDYTFEAEALVAGSKDGEKKLIGPPLVRRLGGIPGALARRELHMPDFTKPDGYKLILVFLEKKGYKKDALDRRLLANRRYEASARRPGQTLQDFFATENMAYADAVKAGVGIDPDRRAYHMFIKSGLTDNHIYSYVYDSEAEGPGATLDPRKIQEVVLRFCDKPWDVDRHRDSRAWASTQDL